MKVVEGTVVYFRDVAFVHDSSPPQTNIVTRRRRVRGADDDPKGRLCLDARRHQRREGAVAQDSGLAAARLETRRGRRSVAFVNAAVSGVIREGAIAAALTGLMILLFLGSWRSTLIIAISIPLAILTADRGAVGDRRNHQRHDARRAGARGRHPGRRRDGDHREHQLPSRRGQARSIDAILDGARADRHPAPRVAALHLHRLRADVRAWRRRRLSVPRRWRRPWSSR